VASIRDLGTGLDTSQPDRKAKLPWKKGDKFISFSLQGGIALTLRASGTEPKLKYYLEVQGENQAAAAELAKEVEADVVSTLLQPEKYGLTASLP
jgi:phosphomannomutase